MALETYTPRARRRWTAGECAVQAARYTVEAALIALFMGSIVVGVIVLAASLGGSLNGL